MHLLRLNYTRTETPVPSKIAEERTNQKMCDQSVDDDTLILHVVPLEVTIPKNTIQSVSNFMKEFLFFTSIRGAAGSVNVSKLLVAASTTNIIVTTYTFIHIY